jgi:DNA invertase Pin-like site-specific DNA recombinase
MSKKTAIYIRVSTKDQSHASQLPDLERWTEANGGEVEWFKDAFTGRTMNRPAMDRLMDQLRTSKIDRIVVWRLDRLGRTTKGLCQLFDELILNNVDLVSLKDGFSLASPAGRLHARILASVAEYETEIRAERVTAGQEVKEGDTLLILSAMKMENSFVSHMDGTIKAVHVTKDDAVDKGQLLVEFEEQN